MALPKKPQQSQQSQQPTEEPIVDEFSPWAGLHNYGDRPEFRERREGESREDYNAAEEAYIDNFVNFARHWNQILEIGRGGKGENLDPKTGLYGKIEGLPEETNIHTGQERGGYTGTKYGIVDEASDEYLVSRGMLDEGLAGKGVYSSYNERELAEYLGNKARQEAQQQQQQPQQPQQQPLPKWARLEKLLE